MIQITKFLLLLQANYALTTIIYVTMRTIPFDVYKKKLADNILSTEDYDALEDRIMEAQWELADEPLHDECDDALITILKKSHAQALAGETHSMEEVECFVNNKIYELTHRMDACRVAEPF